MRTRRSHITRAPYDRNGNLLLTADNVHEWRPNEPFRISLTLCPTRSRGSVGHVVWKDTYGHTYPMFRTSLLDLLQHSTISQGVTLGWWNVTKSGESYGIQRLTVDEIPTR